ncbi:hypothetical protein [Verrucomicrobium sp. BvORR106]|uniref:hypothetical protein n=1 Tax=Verrucomicrobium sp. BvORR106 TaxID=1403819 RepID=UPI00056F51F4|nr:hypothetical protein [Verrucomicrobium sp. BvORR106]
MNQNNPPQGTPASEAPPAPPAFNAFISYRRKDGGRAARWLRSWLTQFRVPKAVKAKMPGHKFVEPLSIFIDEPFSRGVPDYYDDNILPALQSSEFLVVIASPLSLVPAADGNANWVEREIGDFLQTPNQHHLIVAATEEFATDPASVTRLPGGLLQLYPRLQILCLGSLSWLRAFRHSWRWQPRDAALACAASLHHIPADLLPLLRREDQRRRTRTLVAFCTSAALIASALGWTTYQASQAEKREIETAITYSTDLINTDFTDSGLEGFAARFTENRNRLHRLIEKRGLSNLPSKLLETLVRLNHHVLLNQRIGLNAGTTAGEEIEHQTPLLLAELKRRSPRDLTVAELELQFHHQMLVSWLKGPGAYNAESLRHCEDSLSLLKTTRPRTLVNCVQELQIRTVGIQHRIVSAAADLPEYALLVAQLAVETEHLAQGDKQSLSTCASAYGKLAEFETFKKNMPASLAQLQSMERTSAASGDHALSATMYRQRGQLHMANQAFQQAAQDFRSAVEATETVVSTAAPPSSYSGLAQMQGNILQINRATLVHDLLNLCQAVSLLSQPPDTDRLTTHITRAAEVLKDFHASPIPPGLIELPDARYDLFAAQLAIMKNSPLEAEKNFALGSKHAHQVLRQTNSLPLTEIALQCDTALFEFMIKDERTVEASAILGRLKSLAGHLPPGTPPFAKDSLLAYNQLRQARLQKSQSQPQDSLVSFIQAVASLRHLADSNPGSFQVVNDLVLTVLDNGESLQASQPGLAATWYRDALRLLESVPDAARNPVWIDQHTKLQNKLDLVPASH